MDISKRVRDEEKRSDEMYNDKYSYILFCRNDLNDNQQSTQKQGNSFCNDPTCTNCAKSRKLWKMQREKEKLKIMHQVLD